MKNMKRWIVFALCGLCVSGVLAQAAPDAGSSASHLITNQQMNSDLTPQNSIQAGARAQNALRECDSTCAAAAGLNTQQTRTLQCPRSYDNLPSGEPIQTAGGQLQQVSNLQTNGTYSAWQTVSGECWSNPL